MIFEDYDDFVFKEDILEYGINAKAPEEPTREGYNFTGWDIDFDNVTEGLIVRSIFTEETNQAPTINTLNKSTAGLEVTITGSASDSDGSVSDVTIGWGMVIVIR